MFYISGSSDVGIRRKINQDSIIVQKMDSSIGELVFACVCDGMGGLQSGELASATVLLCFKQWIYEALPLLTAQRIVQKDIITQWTHIVDVCNKKILQYGANENISLGTTLTAALFTESEYFIVNIGDTRAYEIATKLKQITHDHSFVQQEVDCGRMSPEEARISKRKNVLTRCIGAKEDVVPDFFFGKIKKNATYVLCSDGFRHKISEPEMLSYFDSGKHSSSEDLKNTEISLIELNKKRQETDNISVVTIIKK